MKFTILFINVLLGITGYSQHQLEILSGDTINLKITGINTQHFYGKTDDDRVKIGTDSVNTYFFQGRWHEVRPTAPESSIMARSGNTPEKSHHIDFYQNLYGGGGYLIAAATIPILLTGVGLLLEPGNLQTGVFIAAGVSLPLFSIIAGLKFQQAANSYMILNLQE